MELSDDCIELIKEEARKLDAGTLTIKIQGRPEDRTHFDVLFGTEQRFRFQKGQPTRAIPKTAPNDKF
jgi:hypothetical protein